MAEKVLSGARLDNNPAETLDGIGHVALVTGLPVRHGTTRHLHQGRRRAVWISQHAAVWHDLERAVLRCA